MPNIKPKKQPSVINNYLNNKASKTNLKNDSFLNISFRHLDTQQGASLQDWQEDGTLLLAVERLKQLCCSSLSQQKGGAIVIYGAFPTNKSEFYHPKYVPEDAEWGRVHINGKQVLAGHFVDDVFYVVFLDNNHSFYKVELKHT